MLTYYNVLYIDNKKGGSLKLPPYQSYCFRAFYFTVKFIVKVNVPFSPLSQGRL